MGGLQALPARHKVSGFPHLRQRQRVQERRCRERPRPRHRAGQQSSVLKLRVLRRHVAPGPAEQGLCFLRAGGEVLSSALILTGLLRDARSWALKPLSIGFWLMLIGLCHARLAFFFPETLHFDYSCLLSVAFCNAAFILTRR